MSDKIVNSDEYRAFIQDVKQRIQSSQIKAAVSVNRELLRLYWELAERMVEKQKEAAWGDGFLLRMSRDLQEAFPGMKGFSKRNLEPMRQWYSFWVREPANAQQLVAQIPWGHNLVIISKIKNPGEALYYVQKTMENNWSRAVLTHHIEGRLYERDGKVGAYCNTPLPNTSLIAFAQDEEK